VVHFYFDDPDQYYVGVNMYACIVEDEETNRISAVRESSRRMKYTYCWWPATVVSFTR